MSDESDKIIKLFGDIESIKLQIARLVSDNESEKGTRQRLTVDLVDRIESVEKELKDILYGSDRKSGIIVQLDRLQTESDDRKFQRKNIIAIWISIGLIFIKELIDWVRGRI